MSTKLDIDVVNLYEIYSSLLTKRQKEIFEFYYYEDMSINEIGDVLNISKNAAFNTIKKVEKLLYNFESKLHIYYNHEYNITTLKAFEIKNEIIKLIK
jgi:predicted DNA-binding protein YlxM (UPF0122 family)